MIALLFIAALPSPYDVRLEIDLPLTASAGALTLVSELVKTELVVPGCTCREDSLNALDRVAVGPYDRAYGLASDVTIGVLIAAPFIASGIEALVGHFGVVDWLKDAIVLAETLALNLALNQIVKFAVQRPRPLVYSAADPASAAQGDAKLSFYSSHASNAFAMTNALAVTFALRHPKSPWRALVWALSNVAAAAVAAMRVGAHMHFVSDVLIGGAVGAAFGLVVPYAHAHHVSVSAAPLPSGGQVSVGYSW
jgi:membrane-associated phospholipid phosphatase